MKKVRTFLLAVVVASVSVLSAEAYFEQVIELYREGRYIEAASILEDREVKSDKIYYYLGLIYYRAGESEQAKKAFLSSWYVNPESKWGKASYKNWRKLTPVKTGYKIRGGLAYDSNVMYAPDYFAGTSDAVLTLNASLQSSPGIMELNLDYDRKQNIIDGSSMDMLGAKLASGKGPYRVSVGAGIALFRYIPFYNDISAGFEAGLLEVGVSKTEYFESDFSHLSNTALTAGLNKSLGRINAGYTYKTLDAEDKETLTYYEAVGSVEDTDYDFQEKAISEGVFLTHSYDSHAFSLLGLFPADEKNTVRASLFAERRYYKGKDKGYYNYWLKDGSRWYYWDDEVGNWAASDDAAPGEKQVSSREDTYLRGSLALIKEIDRNTETEIFYRYEKNISPRDTDNVFFNDRQWQKHSVGVMVNYSF